MVRDELETAAEALRNAADEAEADETRERLETQAEQFETLSNADRGPDHGRLARHEHILRSIAGGEGGAVAEHVDEALYAIHDFRGTLEGV